MPVGVFGWVRAEVEKIAGKGMPAEYVPGWMKSAGCTWALTMERGGTLAGPAEGGSRAWAWVELPGSVLDLNDTADVVRLLASIAQMGGECTRIDLAVDFRDGRGRELIQQIRDACRGGALVRARRHGERPEFRGSQLIRDEATIGRRGDAGSGRYVRVYDKGLETGEAERGEWVRWEAELSGDCARQAFFALTGVDPNLRTAWYDAGAARPEWEPSFADLHAARRIADLALSVVDFREANGQRHLARRPRLAWWSELLDAVEECVVRAKRHASTLKGKAEWLQKSVAPLLLNVAAELQLSVGQALALFMDPARLNLEAGQVPAATSAVRSTLAELRALMRAPERFGDVPAGPANWFACGA